MPTVVGTPPGIVAAQRSDTVPPIPMTGLLGWYDATRDADFTYSAGSDPANPPNKYVSQWKDRSGNNNHAVGNGNPGYHPHRSATINGLKAVNFAAAGSYINVQKGLDIPTVSYPQTKPASFFFVARTPTPVFNDGWMRGGGVNPRTSASGGDHIEVLVVGTGQFGSMPILGGELFLLTFTISATGDWTLRKNGVAHSSGNTGMSPPSGIGALGAGDSSGSNSFNGVIGEHVHYSRVLTASEIQQVEQYLYVKWITGPPPIPTTGLVRWWDAADETTIDLSGATPAAMMRWRDKALSGQNFYHNPGPLYGTRLLNGKKVLDFVPATNPSTQTGEGPGITVSQPNTWILVVQTDVIHTGWDNMLSCGSQIVRQAQSQWNIYAGANNVFGGTANTSPHVLVGTINGASSTIHLDGALLATGDAGVGLASAGIVLSGFDGAIGELILYNRVLSNAERQQVESTLKTKWGTP